MDELKNAVIWKKKNENKNSNKKSEIVEKIINFNKQQKILVFKILNPKKLLKFLKLLNEIY